MKISPADTKCNQTHGEENEISTELADTHTCTEALEWMQWTTVFITRQ